MCGAPIILSSSAPIYISSFFQDYKVFVFQIISACKTLIKTKRKSIVKPSKHFAFLQNNQPNFDIDSISCKSLRN